jgi:hypothetical protein
MGTFVWAHRVINSQKRRFLARAVLQMFAHDNLPEVTVELELCRRFPGSQIGTFSLIDTPGPDEGTHFLGLVSTLLCAMLML